ncbi:YraN family protein [Moraxella catarrhalis]|uniref:UPF0102 protein AO384_1249 n=1 Tax=Moraxella catarrhalis TaxID=480 RepID=A0A198UGS6_MORCA|nr:YraN family protein [Moraxella catarrhalis]OAU95643.1 putative endonuclease [Moraxella catarrhalis]OAU97394.1 putative endonuclease [Moraxella catarrhalis]OAV01064.1 putative endonuclease [Moraxella catarrhalis]
MNRQSKNKTIKRKQGDVFEQLAVDKLKQTGYEIIVTNFTAPFVGEIDIIARQALGQSHHLVQPRFCTVFVEVRSRTSSVYGTALESITSKKQAKIYQTAERFLINYPKYIDDVYRFDVMVFDLADGLIEHEWITNAF